jgi:hypothetical protein
MRRNIDKYYDQIYIYIYIYICKLWRERGNTSNSSAQSETPKMAIHFESEIVTSLFKTKVQKPQLRLPISGFSAFAVPHRLYLPSTLGTNLWGIYKIKVLFFSSSIYLFLYIYVFLIFYAETLVVLILMLTR